MTANEVARYTAVDLPFNLCTMRELYNIEYRQARTKIGFDFWQRMVAAKADYSSAEEYSHTEAYEAGDVVKYKGVYYEATEASTGVLPSNSHSWEEAPKFDPAAACAALFEEIWCTFLAPYLASIVLAQRLPFVHTRIKDVGVLNYEGESYDTANEESYSRLIKAVYRDAEMIEGNMRHFINQPERAGLECVKDYIGLEVKENCEHEQGSGETRTGAARRVPGGYDFG